MQTLNFTFVDSKGQTRYNAVYTGYCSPGAGQENFNLYINGCDTDGRSFGTCPLDNLSRNTFNIALLYDPVRVCPYCLQLAPASTSTAWR